MEKLMTLSSIILAAGQGTRMKSALPKVLHPLMGKPLVWYSIEAAVKTTGQKPILVTGHGAEEVHKTVGDSAIFVTQEPQLGTGHAVRQVEALLRGAKTDIIVTYADMPLLKAETLTRLAEVHYSSQGPLTMLTVTAEDPRGFGRVVRDESGTVREIVEEAQATPEQLAIRELNTGVYCFSGDWLWKALEQIQLSPKGEYYLTDLIGIATDQGHSVQAIQMEDRTEVIGINTRVHLAEAENLLRARINHEWMLAGVTIIDPANTYIEPAVSIGQDAVIWPNTYLHGKTIIGAGCTIGPNSILRDSQVGEGCTILFSTIEHAILEDNVEIGPYGHLRKGAYLARGVHMGNFGEVKNSYLGPGTKMGHFSYLGDAQIGPDVNIGAGTITCNFDGENKNTTVIEEGAFIGSDTMLVAPLKIGKGARTGAGAVVTKDVPDNTLVVGVPARSIKKLENRD
jgi:bifunctional UDP-N-acetylglucosamine pyrophosphorylase / glucosamine-1-phosphate N-acetyltransferase